MAARKEGFAGERAFQLRFVRVGVGSRGEPERANHRFWWERAKAKWAFWSFRRFIGGEKLAANEDWDVDGGGARAAGDRGDVRGADELFGNGGAESEVWRGV